ncbi:polyphosphate kinase [Salmonella bongori]|nr:polyphosphate kinase [Salmonella bongori]
MLVKPIWSTSRYRDYAISGSIKRSFATVSIAIRERDVLLYYPYHTFEHVLELLRQASFDPSVLAIKINIYRVAKDSRIIDSMIHAAHNGKKVTVVVELQARFDEEANIHWAKRLTEAGVHVIFSAPGVKNSRQALSYFTQRGR